MTVAPLTAAVLADADEGNAGIASAVNNAIARVARLLATAAIGAVVAAQFSSALDARLEGVRMDRATAAIVTQARQRSLGTVDAPSLPAAGARTAEGGDERGVGVGVPDGPRDRRVPRRAGRHRRAHRRPHPARSRVSRRTARRSARGRAAGGRARTRRRGRVARRAQPERQDRQHGCRGEAAARDEHEAAVERGSISPGPGVPCTATKVATPSAPPICRNAVLVATPVASAGPGTASSADPVSAGRLRPTPMPVMIEPGRKWLEVVRVGRETQVERGAEREEDAAGHAEERGRPDPVGDAAGQRSGGRGEHRPRRERQTGQQRRVAPHAGEEEARCRAAARRSRRRTGTSRGSRARTSASAAGRARGPARGGAGSARRASRRADRAARHPSTRQSQPQSGPCAIPSASSPTHATASTAPMPSGRRPRRVADLREVPADEREAHEPQRHVDDEDPVPAQARRAGPRAAAPWRRRRRPARPMRR